MKKIILFFVACVLAQIWAAGLPGGLDDAGNLVVAWELKGVFDSGEEAYPVEPIYLALGDKDYIADFFPPPSPDAKDDYLAIKYGTQFYRLVSYRIAKNAAFRKNWELCIRTQDGRECPITLTCVFGALPDNVTLKFWNKSEQLIADWSAVKDSASVTVVPGDYILVAELQFFDTEASADLLPGWNLLANPFDPPREAVVGGQKLLEDIPVYSVSERSVFERVLSWEEIPSGKDFWVYWDGKEPAELVMKGLCRPGNASLLAEGIAGKWNFLGVQGAYDVSKKALCPPSGKLPEESWSWDASLARFVQEVESIPGFFKGYLFH